MTPILQAGLPNAGVVRTFPRALVHGPISRQGLGIPKLYITQGVQHLLICLSYGHKPEDPTGFLLRASCQQLQLELGARQQFWDLDYKKWAHLATKSWVKNTWQFISDNGLQLQTDLPGIHPRRHQDLFLMDIFINSAKYSLQELQQLNWCRLYLQVITVADITDASGHKILHHIWQGNKDIQPRAQYAWPNQGKPSRGSWIVWRAALARTLGMTPHRPNHNCKLGDWTMDGQTWQWYYSPHDERLYENDKGQWYWYPKTTGRASRNSVNRFRYTQKTRTQDTPAQLQRATTIRFRDTITLMSFSPAPQPPIPLRRAPTFLQHLQEAHPSVLWAFQKIEITGSPPESWLPHAIQSGECIAVSDGSFKDGISTASIIIEGSEHRSGRIRLRCRIPGQHALQDSYRAELGGLYSGCQVIAHAAAYFNIDRGNITYGCDGLGVKSCFGWRRQSANFPSHDLVMAIQHTFALHPGIHGIFHHIKGHQDDVQGAELDRWALLNIACDLDAKAYREAHEDDLIANDQPILGAPWALFDSDKNKYLSDLKPKLHELLGIQAAEQYWDNRHRFQDGSSNDIDWIATGGAMQAFPRKVRREVSKHASGHFATKTKLFYWKQAADKLCPRCKTAIEDATHVHLCTHRTNVEAWELALEELELFLAKKNTCPEIQDIILLRLRQWAFQQPYTSYTGSAWGLDEAVRQQDRIGWQAAFEGCWAKEWRQAQDKYIARQRSRYTSKRWLIAVIKKLWEIAWDLWDKRNRIMHDKELEQQHGKLRHDIRMEFLAGFRGLSTSVRALYKNITVKHILDKHPSTQQAWLVRIRSARGMAQTYNSQQARATRRAQDADRESSRSALREWLKEVREGPRQRRQAKRPNTSRA
jgi:hypothetical protein